MTALAAHIACGLGTVLWRFPRHTQGQRTQKIRRWSQRLLRILGLRLSTHGQPVCSDGPLLLLSNHVSWLDIHALSAVLPARFVAKSEVRDWPIVGQLCTHTGTLFVDRGDKHDTRRVNDEIALALRQGCDVALFPEGTTTDGSGMRPFRSSLLQAAMEEQALIQPVYLRYLDSRGEPSTLPAYYGDISFGASLWRLMGARRLQVELHFLPPLRASQADNRRALAQQIESQIRTHQEALRLPAGA